ncbi:MAG: response regulator transcription factor [Legionella sp.]|nr:response regulator transcription factor [Legionella sp.]
MSESSYLLFIDEHPVREEIRKYFVQFNIDIVHRSSLYPLPDAAHPPLAILIHWTLLQGEIDYIQKLYHTHQTPLIITSDRKDEDECIKALEAGADDYIINPIYPRELHARITAINRRVLIAKNNSQADKDVYCFNGWRLYPAARRVFDPNDKELFLSMGEYDLLLAFVQQPQRILAREYLLQLTKNSDLNPFDRRIDVQISRLRQKIEPDAKKPELIKTIRNGGYLFTAEVSLNRAGGNTP